MPRQIADDVPPLHSARRMLGEFGDTTVVIIDVGVLGALIEHYGELSPGEQRVLSLHWRGRDFTIPAEVVRGAAQRYADSSHQTLIYHSQIRFEIPGGNASDDFKEFVLSYSSDVLTARAANAFSASGIRVNEGAKHAAELLEPREVADAGYLELRLVGDLWIRTSKLVDDQPPDGFTVSSYESAAAIDDLCRTYEEADEAGRDLIRQMARMSLGEPSEIPPRPLSD